MDSSIIYDFIRGRLGTMTIILLMIAMGSAYFTFGGLVLDATGFLAVAGATIFAILSGVTIYLFWFFTLRIVPFLKTPIKLVFGWLTVAFGLFLIFWMSSAMNATALRGKEASERYVHDYIKEASITLGETYKGALRLRAMITDFKGHERKYSAFAEDEYKRGIYSGVPGTGAVHLSLVTVSGRMSQLVKDTDDFSRAIETGHSSASKRLKVMRRIRLSDKPLPERMRMIEEQSDLLLKDLADMDPRLLAESIKRTADSLPSEIDVRGIKYSRNATVATRQRAAITRLIDDVSRTSAELSTTALSIIESDVRALELFEPVSPSRAVRIMWKNYLPHWIASVALDWAALPVLILFSILLAGKTAEERALDRIKSRPIGDVLDSKVIEDAIRKGILDGRGTKALIEANMGHQPKNDGENNDRID